MAKKIVSQVTQAMSLEDMRAAVAAADLAAKAAEAAAKLAAKKSVGRPGRNGTEQRTYHQSADAIAALSALKSATGKDLSVLVDEAVLNLLYSDAKAQAIFSAMSA
jgi:hypothetical protein